MSDLGSLFGKSISEMDWVSIDSITSEYIEAQRKIKIYPFAVYAPLREGLRSLSVVQLTLIRQIADKVMGVI